MTTRSNFTGRSRRGRTPWTVRASDSIAKFLIIVGGIGTILAVSLVCVFLVWVAAPLFFQAAVLDERVNSEVAPPATIARIATDGHQSLAWTVSDSGSLYVHALRGDALGELVSQQDAAELFGDRRPTASYVSADGGVVAFGFDDGGLQSGRVAIDIKLLEPNEAPEEVRALEVGQALVWNGGVVERTPSRQYRLQTVRIELDEPVDVPAGAAVRLIDRIERPRGAVLCSISEDGVMRVGVEKTRRNLLTGETTSQFDSVTLPLERNAGDAAPAFLRLSGSADSAYVAWEDGTLHRYDIAVLKRPRLVEKIDLVAEEGGTLTAFETLVGRTTLVVGDSLGRVRGWFKAPIDTARTGSASSEDGYRMVAAHEFAATGSPVASLSSSGRSRLFAVGHEDGTARVYNMTTQRRLFELTTDAGVPLNAIALAPKDNGLIAAGDGGLANWRFDPRHPEATLSALFLPVWYEGYSKPTHMWQSTSGDDAFEPKLGMWPLVFGTLKATFYSLLFGVPIALLAAIYTSEFLHPSARTRIKPMIELMAGLPSVVLGFLAALVFAPVIERLAPTVLTAFVTIPVSFFFGAFVWQMMPNAVQATLGRARFMLILCLLPLGPLAAWVLGPRVEDWLFTGDIRAWLANPALGNGTGGWMLVLAPVAFVGMAMFVGWRVDPFLRKVSANWSRQRAATVDLAKFILATIVATFLAWFVSWLLASPLAIDPRGSLFGVYEPRNSLVVGFVMGFAIIPIIYTLADDALTSVPQHLRSASLGAGATQWQTATRVIIPTAMSGLFSAVMIGLGRAVGETMIVLMATGSTPVLDVNIFNGFRTLSANIAIELPEAVQGSTHYRTLFLAALLLFSMTFVLNTVAEIVRRRFRARAYQL